MKDNTIKGFTLIELLVVMSIIAILAALAFTSYMGTLKSARDTQRRNDLKQYQTMLEQYANNNPGSLYPDHGTTVIYQISADPALCKDIGMSPCTYDPMSGTGGHDYYYSASSDNTKYKIWTPLEAVSATTYWEICSTGRAGETIVNPIPLTDSSSCDLP